MEWYYILATCIVWGVSGYLLGKYQERFRWKDYIGDKYLVSSNDWFTGAHIRALFNEFCELQNIHWLDNKTQQFIKKYKLHNDEE